MNEVLVKKNNLEIKTRSVSILEQAISATPQTDTSQVQELLKALTKEALVGTVVWNKNILNSINIAIAEIDKKISRQLTSVMHHEQFTKLEGTWRGIHFLVNSTDSSSSLKIKILNASKQTIAKDVIRASDFDQSQLFKKIYENEFGSPGGEPYSALIGDFEFSNHPEDIEVLTKISNISAAAFCPFISAADAKLFGFNDWSALSKPRDLEKIFDSVEYSQWRSLRESADSRFLVLTMPRVLARSPYGQDSIPVKEFNFEETALTDKGQSLKLDHNEYCWMNAAYVLGSRLTNAFSKYGWCTAIRGAESGGRIDRLAVHSFVSDDGDMDYTCPTEIGITDRREAELSRLGFLPLCHYKNSDYAVFFGAQTLQKSQKYDKPEANTNALISTRLPYIMATSRFAHYLKVMARDKIGSFLEVSEVELWLNRWINNYVNANSNSGQDMKSKYPLAEAKVQVEPVPGKPGAYQAIAWLKPWLQLEELNSSLRLVANIPQLG